MRAQRGHVVSSTAVLDRSRHVLCKGILCCVDWMSAEGGASRQTWTVVTSPWEAILMAMRSPAPSHWRHDDLHDRPERLTEGRAERLASWLVVYLAALLSCLALVGSAWALGLVR